MAVPPGAPQHPRVGLACRQSPAPAGRDLRPLSCGAAVIRAGLRPGQPGRVRHPDHGAGHFHPRQRADEFRPAAVVDRHPAVPPLASRPRTAGLQHQLRRGVPGPRRACSGRCTFPRTAGRRSTVSTTSSRLAICVSLPGRYGPGVRPTPTRRAQSCLDKKHSRQAAETSSSTGRRCASVANSLIWAQLF